MIGTLQGVAETSWLFLNISIAFLGTLLSACSCRWNVSEGDACHLQSEVIQMKMAFHAPFPLATDAVKDFLEALDGWSLK